MNHSFYATLNASIEISDEDFDLICNCCKHHYDFTVQSSVELGGFLYGIKGRRDWIKKGEPSSLSPKDLEDLKRLDLSNRQIGLICKSLEMTHTEQAYAIGDRFYKIAQELMAKQEEINNILLLKEKE